MLIQLIILVLTGSCVADEFLDLNLGSECVWNNVRGKCVYIQHCLSSYIDFKEKVYAPICSFQGKDPIICCTDCKFYDTSKVFINDNLGFLHKTGKKSYDKCLEYVHRYNYPCKSRQSFKMFRNLSTYGNCYDVNVDIVQRDRFVRQYSSSLAGSVGSGLAGGFDAVRIQFPHMALLGYGADVTTAKWHCGGSVISERFILTAAHCLSSITYGPVKYVLLGILRREDSPEIWQNYNVKRAIPYPEYKSPSKYHDIALLETDTEVRFSSDVLPACLHTFGEPNIALLVTGWGALGYREELANNLQLAFVTQYSEEECMKDYPPHRHLIYGYNHTTQMCYGDRKEAKDTCEGDSGGPLQAFSTCTYVIYGVTSYGKQCGISAGSGVYTRVIYYVPWIESIVWP